MPKDKNTILFTGVQIRYRNFEGKEGQYNKAGDRNFALLLDEETAEAMETDGWNVKRMKIREEDLAENPDQVPQAYLPVALGYNSKVSPPKVFMITDRGKTALTEDTVAQLDWVDIQNVDMTIRPYNYDVNGNVGIKAYVQSLYVTIDEDELDRKYADLESQ